MKGKTLLKSYLHAFVSRGTNTGKILFPHRHEDGSYVVSRTRFEKDYVRLTSESEILDKLEEGYGLRMSNSDEGVTAPSLVMPGSIYRPVVISPK